MILLRTARVNATSDPGLLGGTNVFTGEPSAEETEDGEGSACRRVPPSRVRVPLSAVPYAFWDQRAREPFGSRCAMRLRGAKCEKFGIYWMHAAASAVVAAAAALRGRARLVVCGRGSSSDGRRRLTQGVLKRISFSSGQCCPDGHAPDPESAPGVHQVTLALKIHHDQQMIPGSFELPSPPGPAAGGPAGCVIGQYGPNRTPALGCGEPARAQTGARATPAA